MRVIAGAHRGRKLVAPAGDATRPTSDRARQALFDMLAHAPWAEPDTLQAARVLDAFAGSGALGLEALSRGATHATFMENSRPAQGAIRANIETCREGPRTNLLPTDATRPPRAPAPCSLVFLDPPYGAGLLPRALAALADQGWFAPRAILCLEMQADETLDLPHEVLADRKHGAARLLVLRAA